MPLPLGRSILFAAFIGSAVACGAPEEEPPPATLPSASSGSGIGKARGSVTIPSDLEGTLNISLFKSLPPSGPPTAKVRYPGAGSSHSYELAAPVGSYKLTCFLDVNDDNPMQPAANDPGCIPVDVTLTSDGVVTADLTVTTAVDPSTRPQ